MTPKNVPVPHEFSASDRRVSEGKIVYLACPYTHPDDKIREERYQAATQAAASLIRQGNIVYSPITMTHPIDIILAGTTGTLGSDYWVSFDEAFMDVCSEMLILTIDGWEDSSGIRREMAYFKKQSKPVSFLAPENVLLRFSPKDVQANHCCD